MPTLKMAPNLPVKVELGYIDIVPSEKGPPQVRLKGTIDGAEKTYAYLPGKLDETIATLVTNGIVGAKDYPSEVDKPFEVKPLKKSFTMMKEQLAGDKYGTFKIVGGTSAAPATAGGTGGSAPAPAAATPLTPEQLTAEKAKYCTTMKQATAYVLDNIRPLFEAKNIPLNDETVYKFGYSIWQKWSDRGLIQ